MCVFVFTLHEMYTYDEHLCTFNVEDSSQNLGLKEKGKWLSYYVSKKHLNCNSDRLAHLRYGHLLPNISMNLILLYV